MKMRNAFDKPLLMRQLSNYHIKQDSFMQTILENQSGFLCLTFFFSHGPIFYKVKELYKTHTPLG